MRKSMYAQYDGCQLDILAEAAWKNPFLPRNPRRCYLLSNYSFLAQRVVMWDDPCQVCKTYIEHTIRSRSIKIDDEIAKDREMFIVHILTDKYVFWLHNNE